LWLGFKKWIMILELELKNPQKIGILLELLRSLDFVGQVRIAEETAVVKPDLQRKRPLKDFIGSIPELDVAAFEKYLQETRAEWERDIF
jgi:hypothetical protein